MGAQPRPPDATADDLKAAQEEAASANRRASTIDQLYGAADLIGSGGTHGQGASHFADHHYGDAVRQAGQQGVQNVKDRADQANKTEDQSFRRNADQRAQGADQRTAKAFEDSQAMNTPGTREAKAYEALFRAKRPAEAKGITPEQAAGFSANDWKEALATKDDPTAKVVGGAGGGKGLDREVAQRMKAIPKNSKGISDMLDHMESIVTKVGGPDKIQGIGGPLGLKALEPGIMLDPDSQQFHQMRQQISNMNSNQIFGSALSPTEAGRFDKAIADVSTGHSMAQVMNGMQVIREMTQSGYDQAMAGSTAEAKARIGADMGSLGKPHPSAAVHPAASAPTDGSKIVIKGGRKMKVYADGTGDWVD